MPRDADNPFWDWSLRFYAEEQVSDALMTLQDRFDCNVNLVLWIVWCHPSATQIEEAQRLLRPFTASYTAPLRQMRRRLPKDSGSRELRETVKRAELLSERHEQDLLLTVCAQQNFESDGRASINAYVQTRRLDTAKMAEAAKIFNSLLAKAGAFASNQL